MQVVLVVSILCLVGIYGAPYNLVEYGDGRQYALVPIVRVARQINVSVAHKGNLLDDDKHRPDEITFASKLFKPNGPPTIGGSLDFNHKPSGNSLNIEAADTNGSGLDLEATGKYNLYDNGKASLGLSGQYERHYGGTGEPNYNVGLVGSYKI